MRQASVKTWEKPFDAVIVGGGLSGLAAAACLGAAGFSLAVLERQSAKDAARTAKADGRTVALSYGSVQILEKAGVWKFLKPTACPILDIRVADQDSSAFLDFGAREVGDQPFGWIVEIPFFTTALQKRLKQLKNVRVVTGAAMKSLARENRGARVTLQDKRIFAAPLVIAADGRTSSCRAAAAIPVHGWGYGQTAMVCAIAHEKPHNNVAVEHFLPGGPLATLPMRAATALRPAQKRGSQPRLQQPAYKHRSSIVWTEKTKAAAALINMSDADFTEALEDKVRPWLGRIKLAGPRNAFPLSLKNAARITAKRLALIGDAAHGIHPIAGQGFNLGMGDIGVLTEELVRGAALGLDTGDAAILRAYEKARRFPNGNMAVMTDVLDRLFSNSIPPVEAARRFGLQAVQHLPPLKRFFMRQAMAARKPAGRRCVSA